MTKPRKLSEYTIAQDLGECVCERVKTAVIRTLDAMEGGLSGDDSGLGTLWEEICVQVQHVESIYWGMYDSTARETIQHVVEELPPFEREALWLLTEEGSDWQCCDESDRATYPICVSDIVRHVVENAVYEEARCSTNPNVLKYLRRKFDDDGGDEMIEEEGDDDNDEEDEMGEVGDDNTTPTKSDT